MNRLLILLVAIVICAVGLGYYMEWFRFDSDNTDGKTHITLTVDQKKIQGDEKKAVEKVHDFGGQGKE